MTASASSTNGNVSMMFTSVMIVQSTRPPKYPAPSPMSTPSDEEISTAVTPTSSDTRPP